MNQWAIQGPYVHLDELRVEPKRDAFK